MEFVETTIKSGLTTEMFFSGDEMAMAALSAEKSSVLGDEFVVDDFLDFDGLTEPEKETEAAQEIGKQETEGKIVIEEDNSNSSFSSVISFDPAPELSLPAHDAAEFEWVSRFTDDFLAEFPPCSGALPLNPDPKTHTQNHTQAASLTPPVKAKRSKRSRTGSFGWSRWGSPLSSDSTLVLTPFNDSTSSSTTTTASSSSSSSSHSSYFSCDYTPTTTLLSTETPPPPKKLKLKKRGRKSKSPTPESSASSGERRCNHCGVQKTPQWRAGPMGAKTLCNACGVRYKSGRLLPEYRPACSPTFVNQLHSNSHRKVLEMRRKKEELLMASVAPPVASF